MILVFCAQNHHERSLLPEWGDDTFVPCPPGFVATRRDVLYLPSEIPERR